jgi:hypothetical protein
MQSSTIIRAALTSRLLAILTFGLCLPACSSNSHQLGLIPISGTIAGDARARDPLDADLFVKPAAEDSKLVPLVRVAYWKPSRVEGGVWYRDLLDLSKDNNRTEDAYMIIDVSNLHLYTDLGARDCPELFERRLRRIAEMLLIAADRNGEIYWRSLVADLESYRAGRRAGEVLIGAGVGAAFFAPPIGATLAGVGLVTDMWVDEMTDGLNVDEYASLRESAALYRATIRGRIADEVEGASSDKMKVQLVLQLANDYAFTYSIKGALYGVQKQNEELRNLLITGESAWQKHFAREREAFQTERNRNVQRQTQQINELNNLLRAQQQFQRTREETPQGPILHPKPERLPPQSPPENTRPDGRDNGSAIP